MFIIIFDDCETVSLSQADINIYIPEVLINPPPLLEFSHCRIVPPGPVSVMLKTEPGSSNTLGQHSSI